MAAHRNNEVISLHFNQDQGCFICCMESGLRVYNSEPLVEQARYNVDVMGSIRTAEMLWRTNVVAVVGGGSRPKFADNTVLVYDDATSSFSFDISFSQPVRSVKMRRDKLIVALSTEVHIFSFPPPINRLLTVETRENPKGLLETAALTSAQKQLLAFPGHKIGSVQMLDLASVRPGSSGSSVVIEAHISELACITVNNHGTLIATASVTGTLIRVWDTTSKEKLIELRRGTDQATFYCMNFSGNSEFLCASSDKGTIHIFAIKDKELNKKYQISRFTSFLSQYMDSNYSFANFTVPPECACICAFSKENTIIVICTDGSFHKYSFTTDGQCERISYDMYLEVCNEDF